MYKRQAFAEDAETLFLIADSALPNFSGGNGRYRYAKAVELSSLSLIHILSCIRFAVTCIRQGQVSVFCDINALTSSCLTVQSELARRQTGLAVQPVPVSYTHLDVYKRQLDERAQHKPTGACQGKRLLQEYHQPLYQRCKGRCV